MVLHVVTVVAQIPHHSIYISAAQPTTWNGLSALHLQSPTAEVSMIQLTLTVLLVDSALLVQLKNLVFMTDSTSNADSFIQRLPHL